MICTHFKKVNKQEVTKFIAQAHISTCLYNHPCKMPNICLNCKFSLCSSYSNNNCANKHFEESNHSFILIYNNGAIICQQCKSDIQQMLDNYTGEIQEDAKKLKIFIGYIKKCWKQKKLNEVTLTVQERQQVFGLTNLGNTCFFNSVIQSLFYTEIFRNIYLSLDLNASKVKYKAIPKEIEYFYDQILDKDQGQWIVVNNNKKNKQQTRKKLLIKDFNINKQFKKLLQEAPNNQIYVPTELFQAVCKIQKKFKQLKQNDAQQLLRILLDALSEGELIFLDLNQQRYKKVEKVLGRQKINIITNIFGSYLASRINCLKCQYISWNLDLSLDFTVQVKPKLINTQKFANKVKQEGVIPKNQITYYNQLKYPEKNDPLPQILENFFSYENLTKQNFYSCQKCKASNALKKFYLINPSPIITIVLKRFNQKGNKDYSHVDIEERISLNSIVLEGGQWNYELYSVIVHEGSINNGHYVSFNKLFGKWIEFSDEKIRNIAFSQIQKLDCYILFYKKVK